ncbi:prohibitin family protein [Clostridium sp. 'deep sea']|uniref:SPFH domain-containing protein n=1 Tax=Clostridium sp. 'deep sea' TaxID=2779445 RepID=UPI00189699A5|nr:SPFH domain-containing protein [Clostridium sp. 'deep sea']QOR34128.1 prohibitin family protein [Clostridium sp. 'deep sea']
MDFDIKVPKPKSKKFGGIIVLVVLLVALVGFASRTIVIIPANTVGIRFAPFNGGVQDEMLSEGLKIVMPWDKVYKISTEVQSKRIEKVYGQTKDAQFLTISIDVKYKIDEDLAFQVFKNFKTMSNVDKDLIYPTTKRSIEGVTTEFNIIEILGSNRNEVYASIEKELAKRLQVNGINLHSITFLDTDAGEDIEKAIRAEAVAKKAVETAEQNRIKAEIEAQRRIIEAEAEAKEKKIIAESISKNPEIIELEWIKKWDGKLPEIMTGEGNGMILDLNKNKGN